MRLHILTLNWNGLDKLQRLRKGLANNIAALTMFEGRLKHGFQFPEWHIRDNGSKESIAKEVFSWSVDSSNFGISATLYEIGHNRDNFAKGMNFLFEKANPDDDDLILLLNNDVDFADSHSLTRMYELQKRTDAGVVGARLLYPEGKKPWESRLQHAGVIFGERYNRLPYHFRHKEVNDRNSEKDRYFQVVTAACCLVKPSSFKRIGGMDEGFSWAFDDVDMCLRIGEKDKIVYCGETQIFHEESASLKKNPVNKMFLNNNVKHFRDKWTGKYEIDHDKYLKNPSHNLVQ